MPEITYPEEQYQEYEEAKEESKSPVKNVNVWAMVCVSIAAMIFVFLVMIYELSPWYAGAFILITIIVIYLLTKSKEDTGYMNLPAAYTLVYHNLFHLKKVENLFQMAGFRTGEVEIGAGYLHTHPLTGEWWVYQIGIHLTSYGKAPKFFSAWVDAKKSGIGFIRFTPQEPNVPYKGELREVQIVRVPASEWNRVWGRTKEFDTKYV